MGMVLEPLNMEIDLPVPQVVSPLYGGQPRGEEWITTASNVSVSHDRLAYFLTPYQWTREWTTSAGVGTPYARRRLADFSATGAWTEFQWRQEFDYWLSGAAGSTLTTMGSAWSGDDGELRPNPWLFIESYAFDLPGVHGALWSVSFGGRFRFILYGNGQGLLQDYVANETLAFGPLVPQADATHESLKVSIFPLRKRSIYVLAERGGRGAGFVWTDLGRDLSTDDTAPDAADPLIEAATASLEAFAPVHLSMTEMRFPASGYLAGTLTLPVRPTVQPSFETGEETPLVKADEPTGTTVEATAPGFAADGDSYDLPLRVDMDTTDDRVTPVFHSVGFWFPPVVADRDAEAESVLSLVLSGATLDYRETSSEGRVVLKDAAEWRAKVNRVVSVKVGTGAGEVEVFRGYATDPATDNYQEWQENTAFRLVDEWARLDRILVPNMHALDGLTISGAMREALRWAGTTEDDWDIDETTATMPVTTQSMGHDGEVETAAVQAAEAGTLGDLVRYIASQTNWLMDWSPVGGKVRFRFKNPDTLSTTPVLTLYHDTEQGRATDGDGAIEQMARDWEQRTIEPEATEVWAVGRDSEGNTLQAVYPPPEAGGGPRPAEDPELPEGDRPTNWTGERWLVVYRDDSLNSQALVDRAAEVFGLKLTRTRQEASVRTTWHPDVRRGDTIRIVEDASTSDWTDWRIVAISVRIDREKTLPDGIVPGGRKVREADYTLERVLEP